MKTSFENNKDLFEALKVNGDFTRLGKLFRTKQKGYVYDLGTGKVLECGEMEYQILESIFQHNNLEGLASLNIDDAVLSDVLNNIISVIESIKLFQAPPLTEYTSLHGNFDAVKKEIENNLRQVTLELTESCNLRCKYCIYSESNEIYRNFSGEDMTWSTAKKAIDYALKHSGNGVSITFYGGEPLLRFELLKQCVEYAKKMSNGKEITHSMTTNLTLMSKDIAKYLAEQDMFSVVCSLDGPEDIHDENRITTDGKGSFNKVLQGLNYLVEAYGDRAEQHLSLSMVIALPATSQKLEKIQKFLDSLSWLPSKMTKNISYVTTSSSERNERLEMKKMHHEGKLFFDSYDPLSDWYKEKTIFSDDIDSETIFTSSFTQSAHLRIHKRCITGVPVGLYGLNGCCHPASRRLFVTAEGNFSLCEKIGKAPFVGNVRDGININSIKKHYIDDFINITKKICADCWAIKLCGVCYVDCYNTDGIVEEFKKDLCGYTLINLERSLIDYHEVLERFPERLEYLNDIVMT